MSKKRKLEDRVQKVERALTRTKPELKHFHIDINQTALANNTVVATDVTACGQGTQQYQRVGNEMKVMRIEVDIYSTISGVDLYLQRPHDAADIPNSTHFAAGTAHPMRSWNANLYQVYRHDTTDNDNNKLTKWVVNFPNGCLMRFNGALQVNSPIYFTIANYCGTSAYVTGFIRTYFTDA